MITQIEGRYVEHSDQSVTVDVNGLYYEVFISKNVLKTIEARKPNDRIRLFIYHYVQTDPSKALPILVGFNNKIEREFFEKFITVSGIGPKAALKALSVPIREIAQAIDAADRAFLKTLPGVGEQRSREIIAKLQGRVGRFGLIQDGMAVARSPRPDVKEDALEVLLQLEYRKEEASAMVEKALAANPLVRSSEDLLNEVFRQRMAQGAQVSR